MTDLVFQITLTGKFTYVNPVSERYGYKQEEMIGKNFTKFVPKKELPRYFTQIKRMITGEKIDNFESSVIHKNGCIIPTEFSGQMVKVGKKHYINGIMRNISERKKLEIEKEKIDKRYKLILENSNCPITYLDLEGNIILINKLGAMNLNSKPDELIGQSIYEKLPEFADEQKRRLNTILKSEKGITRVDLIALPDSKKWFLSDLQPVKDEEGEINGIQIFSIDITDQKEIERKLRKSEEKWESLVNNFPFEDRIVEVDKNGNILYTNRVSSGREINKIIGRNVLDFVIPDNHEVVKKSLESVFNSGSTKKYESKSKNSNGEIVIYDAVAAPIKDNNSVKSVIILARDITNRKKFEESLRDSEEKYSTLFQHSNDSIFIHDLKGSLIDVNKQTLKLFGYEKNKILTKNIKELHPSYALEKSKSAFKEILEKGSINFEIDFKKKNNDIFSAEVSSSIYQMGGKKVIQGIVRDVTERKKAENEIKFSEEKYRSIFESSLEGIVISDLKGKILEVNTATLDIFGYEMEEMIGKSAVLGYAYPEQRESMFQKLMKNGFVRNQELVFKHKDGAIVNILGSAILLRDKNENVDRVFSIFSDITKRKKNEEQIKKSKDYLQNVIDSTYEVIFTVDSTYKIRTWNKTAENITGIKRKNIVGKYLKQINVFENPEEINRYIQNIIQGKKGFLSEITLNTTYSTKRIFSISPSYIRDLSKNISEVIFVCRDVTFERELYGKLKYGNNYIISDAEMNTSLDIFKDLIKTSIQGLYIGRKIDNQVKNALISNNIKILKLSDEKIDDISIISTLEDLYKSIKDFVEYNKKSVVLIGRVDYLISRYSFENSINILYRINDLVQKHKSIFLLRVNPSTINAQQLSVLNEEFDKIPSQKTSNIQIGEELFEILEYIHKENIMNKIVTYSRIGSMFNISKVTVKKRIELLLDIGLIYVQKQGKRKVLNISEKGINILK